VIGDSLGAVLDVVDVAGADPAGSGKDEGKKVVPAVTRKARMPQIAAAKKIR